MAETVAHTVDHVFPPVPLRHRVLRWFARIDLLNADEALDAGAAQPSPPVATSGEDSAETLYRSPCR